MSRRPGLLLSVLALLGVLVNSSLVVESPIDLTCRTALITLWPYPLQYENTTDKSASIVASGPMVSNLAPGCACSQSLPSPE